MILSKETIYKKDLSNKKIKVTREFEASVDRVWNAWTKPEILDQWWAPKPWKANTVSMDFKAGGRWFYYMQGPDGTRHYCKVDYDTIKAPTFFSGDDAFCDDKGNTNTEFPSMKWKVAFNKAGDITKVDIDIIFASEADLEKIMEMGFKEGFAAAHQNLDEILASE